METQKRNSFLLTPFSHPWMPMVLFIPLSALITSLSLYFVPHSIFSTVGWILIGIFSWTLIEYLLHRHLFHLTQVKEPWKSLASGLHMAHHRDVDDKYLILAPPLVSLIFGSFIYLLFAGLTQSFALAALMETGVFMGYIAYEWCHYAAHEYPVTTGIQKYLKAYHLQHHFKCPTKAFGVTSPLWDIIFKTRPE